MELLRTPDERFSSLPEFPFEPVYGQIDDGFGGTIRVAGIDEGPGDGQTVLLLHGEPSWSFLYRHMIPHLVAQGLRCVAPDLVGFGRSDKPSEQSDYTNERHVQWLSRHVFDLLDLNDITMVGQDWGGMLGLRLVAARPERFSRVVVANTGLPDGTRPMGEAFLAWQNFAATTDQFPVGAIINAGCTTDLSAEVIAGYDAPFPEEQFKAGARIFPSLVPTSLDSPSAKENSEAWNVLRTFDKPWLCAFSDGDPITHNGYKAFLEEVPSAHGTSNVTIEGGGHFLQEDRGPQFAAVIAKFIQDH